MPDFKTGLVHIRTPTYRRPEALRRALASMVGQTWQDWVCDVYDDDSGQSGRRVVEDFADPRIRYTANTPQLFASRNIDHCFSASNPHGAEFFCVVEDDNFILPAFCAANIALAREQKVEIVLRNQLIEHDSGKPSAFLSATGVLDDLFTEGVYEAREFRMSLLAGIGVSNGGLFWSVRARSPLEIRYSCTATVQEYLRTYSIAEPIYVALEALAVWAENGDQTTRNAELGIGYLRRELDLKRTVQALRQKTWAEASVIQRRGFLTDPRFAAPVAVRASHAGKALLDSRFAGHISSAQLLRLRARGLAIRLLGRLTPDFENFLASRSRVHDGAARP